MRDGVFLNKIKQNKAFTLLEMLVVVAIMVILMAFSALTISGWTQTFKMTEINNYAKLIYLEAQNQLAAKEVEGGLLEFYDEIMDAGTPFLTVAPKDYEEGDETWNQLCYVTNLGGVNSILKQLIPENAYVNDMGGYYVIEMNPQTGDIYAVFYWEADNADISGYSDIINYDRDADTRKSIALGYYGGALLLDEATMSAPFELDQKVEVINGEELYLKISFKNSDVLKHYYSTSLQIECTVRDEKGDDGYVWTTDVDVSAGKNLIVNNGRMEIYVLLDSMQQSIEQITSDIYGNSLTAGDNLTVEVNSKFSQGAYYCEETTKIDTGFNSLFAAKKVESDTTTIYISKLRHLRNLDLAHYNGESGAANYVIEISADIDMETTECVWSGDTYLGSSVGRLVYGVTPIVNDAVLNNTSGTTTINGANHILKNFLVTASGNNAGLFASAENVVFQNIHLVDITIKANGYNNVGALVGSIRGGSIENCGVYLSTYSTSGGSKLYYSEVESESHGNKMEERYDTFCINGAENVGGLCGKVSDGTVLTKAYSAIKVKGSTNVGGLIGNADSAVITNSYASGDVVGNVIYTGGFIGYATMLNVTDAYSTSNVYGADIIGGLLGYTDNSNYKNCYSYGEVLTLAGTTNFDVNDDGTINVADGDIRAGGLLSIAGCGENTVSVDNTCFYMTQSLYNNHGEFDGFTELGKGYGNLVVNELTANSSYPYDATLLYKVFPFNAVMEHHYGNWALQYLVNTSLVYYEKYANGSYGYYCVTTLTKDDGSLADGYVWVLDTLRKTECIEDGYALLSRYYLEKFDYELQIGSTGTTDVSGTLTVGDTFSGDTAVLLRQQGFLEFKAYEPIEDATDSDYTADYTNEAVKDIFSISGMYLYQLPYDLQCTDRYYVTNFYDKFIVYNGMEKANDAEDAAPVIGGTSATEGVSFFYCPHFAKTAVNPGTSGEDDSQLMNPAVVHVRSARQLNALGRYPYYWNEEGGMADEMTYLQEVDINFGTYADVDGDYSTHTDKTYCGVSFNLMDTSESNVVRNVPIGMPSYSDTYKQFQNTYDGGCYKIIDYCLVSDQQFVGLFGETKGATLRNIVMVVSAEGQGRVVSENFYDESGDGNHKRGGLGALVGLLYEENNTVINCVAAGYDVVYILRNEPPSGKTITVGVAVGGLIGFSMSSISNCAADNDILFQLECDYSKDTGTVFLGGLAGSFFYGSLYNSYCGGSISITGGDTYALERLRVGGMCPGFLQTGDGDSSISDDGTIYYQNLYAYTRIDDSVWNIKSGFSQFIPTVGTLCCTNPLNQTYLTGWTTKCFVKDLGWSTSTSNSYYLSSVITHEKTDDETQKYFMKYTYKYLLVLSRVHEATCNEISFESLSDMTSTYSLQAVNSYPYAEELQGQAYPFPEFITDANGNYIHYGDWPTE